MNIALVGVDAQVASELHKHQARHAGDERRERRRRQHAELRGDRPRSGWPRWQSDASAQVGKAIDRLGSLPG